METIRMKKELYFVVTTGDDGLSVTPHTKDDLLNAMCAEDEYEGYTFKGLDALKDMNVYGIKAYEEAFIIKGSIVLPHIIEKVTSYEID